MECDAHPRARGSCSGLRLDNPVAALPVPVTATDHGASWRDRQSERADPLRPAANCSSSTCGRYRTCGPAEYACRDLLQSDPSSPQFVAYYSGTLDMRARDGGAPWHEMKLLNEGAKTLIARLPSWGRNMTRGRCKGFPMSLNKSRAAMASYIPFPASFNPVSVESQQN